MMSTYSNPFVRHIVFVPKHKPPNCEDVEILKNFISKYNKILILTGAGISTESGECCKLPKNAFCVQYNLTSYTFYRNTRLQIRRGRTICTQQSQTYTVPRVCEVS